MEEQKESIGLVEDYLGIDRRTINILLAIAFGRLEWDTRTGRKAAFNIGALVDIYFGVDISGICYLCRI